MCQHAPPCPPAHAPDRAAARIIAGHPEQGWNLLCNGVVLFEDTWMLLPDAPLSSLAAQQAGHLQMACCRTGHVRAGPPVPYGRAHEGAPRRTPVAAQSGAARPAGCARYRARRRRLPGRGADHHPGPEPGPSPPRHASSSAWRLNHPPAAATHSHRRPARRSPPKLSVPPPNLTMKAELRPPIYTAHPVRGRQRLQSPARDRNGGKRPYGRCASLHLGGQPLQLRAAVSRACRS